MFTSFRGLLSGIKRRIFGKRENTLIIPKIDKDSNKPKVHIGCGPINIEGWINIDARNDSHVHINTDVIDLKNFTDNSLGEIYLCHVLEHFSFEEVASVLEVFYKKLKIGGTLRLSVPDFKLIAKSYLSEKVSLKSLKYALMGGQDYEYNFHKSIYDFETIDELMSLAKFKDIQEYTTQEDFGVDLGDWSTGRIASLPISLNVKAVKK